MINSALVSAQNRKRCYWTNIPFISFPEDKGILLKDVLESGLPWQDKSYCMTSSYNGAVLYNTLERKQRTMVAEPIPINTYQDTDKSRTVMAGYHKYGEATIIKIRASTAVQQQSLCRWVPPSADGMLTVKYRTAY